MLKPAFCNWRPSTAARRPAAKRAASVDFDGALVEPELHA
jgi:hypothetical protein